MVRRVICAAIGVGIAFSQIYAEIPKRLLPTEKEKIAFLNEADDFIDEIPEGLQDRQCDAVLHAMRGNTGELSQVRSSRNAVLKTPSGVSVEDIIGEGSARGIDMRVYRPSVKSSAEMPLLVYFHGGGWSFGSLNSCAAFCSALASTGKAVVVAVDYRLAPENPYPSGLMDCVSAVEYVADHAGQWGSSPSMISLGGDSSGGNLALATALYMQESHQDVKLRSLLLFYPVTKAYKDMSSSWKKYSRGYGLDSRLMEAFNAAYICGTSADVPGVSDSHNPQVSPSDATDDQLGKLPPVLLIGGDRDILFDQGKEFADRLARCGVDSEHIEFSGAVHLFITVKGQPAAFSKAVALSEAFLTD